MRYGVLSDIHGNLQREPQRVLKCRGYLKNAVSHVIPEFRAQAIVAASDFEEYLALVVLANALEAELTWGC